MLFCHPDAQWQSMKIITESNRRRFQLLACLFSFVILAFKAEAHDPGLSSANVTVGDQQIDVLLGFVEKDVDSMLAGRIQPEIELLAAEEFSLFWDKQRARPLVFFGFLEFRSS
jgi:hypothetical protein